MTDTTSSSTPLSDQAEPLIKVRSASDPHSVASAIAQSLYAGKRTKVRAIGAGAVNQAVKACAIAAGFTANRGIHLSIRPAFETVPDRDGGEASAISLIVIGN